MYESIPHELRTMEAGSKRMEPYKRGLLHIAAKAIEELSMKLQGDEAAIAGMKREIERMVRADKLRWIPVTERLPGKYTAVLATGNGEVACGLFVGFAEPAHVTSWDLDNIAAEPVTHWMPLPEPPKEEE